MTQWQRVRRLFFSILTIICAMLFSLEPESGKLLIIGLLGGTAAVRGIGKLLYFFSMARYAVGGRWLLLQGLIFLDFGLFTLDFASFPGQYVMIYLLITHLFYGMIGLMRALEIRRHRVGSWRTKLLTALGNIAISILCMALFNSTRTMVYIYSLGMVWSALGQIVSAFRKTAVLYVQQA